MTLLNTSISLAAFHQRSPDNHAIDRKFRRCLQDLGVWSEHVERLFQYFSRQPQISTPLTAEQRRALSLMTQAAREGDDIAVLYPLVFRDMLMDINLRREFLNMLP